jgi:hypothetical protein
MAQLSNAEILERTLDGEIPADECIRMFVSRDSGLCSADEGTHVDYKLKLDLHDENSYAETARDLLAFSNSSGGLLVFGVSDSKEVFGHQRVDSRALRDKLGPYVGTRTDYELGHCNLNVQGREKTIPFILVPRSHTAYPSLLRKDIKTPGAFSRKVKYLRGSLFYRVNDETRVEPTGGDIDTRASELGFTGASPRTRSSFLLEEDRPGIRLYSHINDRFFGRESEVVEIISKFDDVRGRGVSIAGLGGIGKTELAIEIVHKIFRSGRFKKIYSGSAKQTVLGAFGAQATDPFFSDFPSFLRDLGAWLGVDLHSVPLAEAKVQCLAELKKSPKTLLFLDNLETVDDGRLFQFLDQEIPENVWLLTTSRVHKVRNWIYAKQLDALNPRDAAHLLRHELKRHGLENCASTPIDRLEALAIQLQRHPLLVRWFAWSCKRRPEVWESGPIKVPRDDVEAFCVGQTLKNLPIAAQRLLAAIVVTEGQLETTPDCLEKVASVTGSGLEFSLYELESAGLISQLVDDETGRITYLSVPLAGNPARELARQNHWEEELARGLRDYQAALSPSPRPDPLIRDLLEIDPRKFKKMSADEIGDLKRRVQRANSRPHGFKAELMVIAAECERHLGNIITADDMYREIADQLCSLPPNDITERTAKILLEAATVAKMRSRTEQQLNRAIGYLKAVETTPYSILRVLGTLVELHALKGDKEGYKQYLRRVTNLRDREAGRFSQTQLFALEDALQRARSFMNE